MQIKTDFAVGISGIWQHAHGCSHIAVCVQYGKMAEQCHRCQLQFGLLLRRHNCVICGASVCEKCSNCDLIVYIPDEDAVKAASSAAVAKLAVVKVVGVGYVCIILPTQCYAALAVALSVCLCPCVTAENSR